MDSIATLREENELLRAENHQLKQQLGLVADARFIGRCRELFGMTAGQSRLLRVIMNARTAHRETIFAGYCETLRDMPDIKVLDAQICHIRRHLRPFNINIATVWGQRYRISPDDLAKLNAMLSDEALAA